MNLNIIFNRNLQDIIGVNESLAFSIKEDLQHFKKITTNKDINNIRSRLKKILNSLINNKKIVHGYGASTKGNVLLLYFGLNLMWTRLFCHRY